MNRSNSKNFHQSPSKIDNFDNKKEGKKRKEKDRNESILNRKSSIHDFQPTELNRCWNSQSNLSVSYNLCSWDSLSVRQDKCINCTKNSLDQNGGTHVPYKAVVYTYSIVVNTDTNPLIIRSVIRTLAQHRHESKERPRRCRVFE